MSWTASVPATPAADFSSAVDAAVPSPSPLAGEPLEQFELAKGIAKEIATSGAIGDSSKSYAASLVGHANGEHEPTPGWANDCLTVSVTQA